MSKPAIRPFLAFSIVAVPPSMVSIEASNDRRPGDAGGPGPVRVASCLVRRRGEGSRGAVGIFVAFSADARIAHTEVHFGDSVTLGIIAEAEKTAGLEPEFRESLFGSH